MGSEHVPATGPLIFVLNHPNALIDPLFLLAFSPRRVVFLAKEPLFRIPLIGWITRATGSIPVYRRVDGADASQNQRTFDRVGRVLAEGSAVALFPEGTSHSDPALRPLKTGAARMALGAAAAGQGTVRVVPAGLYYTSKGTFRSSAVLCFGQAIAVTQVESSADGQPAADAVRLLTDRLRDALVSVTLQADTPATLELVARAERILYAAASGHAAPRSVSEQFAVRSRLLKGREVLAASDPERLMTLERLVAEHDEALRAHRLSPENLLPSALTVRGVARYTLSALSYLLLLAPLAMVGIVANVIPYRLIRPLIVRALRVEQDVIATGKVLAAALFFPLTWLVTAALSWHWWGSRAAMAAILIAPLSGIIALRFLERLDYSVGALRGLILRLLDRDTYNTLDAQRHRIREMVMDGEM